MYFKTNLVSCFGEKRETVEREEGEKKRKRKEEEIKPRSRPKRYGCLDFGMELLTLYMNSIMNHMDFVWDSREGYEFQI